MIRAAVPADIPRLVEMGQRFAEESKYKRHIAVDPVAFGAFLQAIIDLPTGIILVTDDLDGFLGFLVTNHPYSGELTCNELFWWVEPESRGAGVRLLSAGEKWARSVGAQKLVMISPNKRVSRFYRKAGFEQLETHFVKEL